MRTAVIGYPSSTTSSSSLASSLHTRTVPSSLALAINPRPVPPRCTSTQLTTPLCPRNLRRTSPVLRSNRKRVWSLLPATSSVGEVYAIEVGTPLPRRSAP